MLNLPTFIGHWGYWAIFLIVMAGNIGVPVPEETVLILSGYLVWKKELWLPAVLAIGMLSATAGDNLGYWLGRRYGSRVTGYKGWTLAQSEKVDRMRVIVARHGALAVFFARFLPGLRFMAGPIAGMLGMPFLKFFVSDVLAAIIYVPVAVAAGYAVGSGFGGWIEQLRHLEGEVAIIVLAGAIGSALLFLGLKLVRHA
jgi:membrane protein DedA with SNARE-associated domain